MAARECPWPPAVSTTSPPCPHLLAPLLATASPALTNSSAAPAPSPAHALRRGHVVSNPPTPDRSLLAGLASAAPGADGVSGTGAKGGKGMSMADRGEQHRTSAPLLATASPALTSGFLVVPGRAEGVRVGPCVVLVPWC